MRGAEALMRVFQEEGVEIVFGYPGGALLPVYDALYQAPFRHVLVRQEQAAAHAASGYTRTTGKPGVCMATSGPGATNLVTGIATAYMDSVPLVIVTGQVGTGMIGTDAFQEVDTRGITMPITKHNYLLKRPEDLVRVAREAFYVARTGRPGPVLIDLPRNVAEAEVEWEEGARPAPRGYRPRYDPDPDLVDRAASLLDAAERPVILAGGGVLSSGATDELFALTAKIRAPVATTLMGIGSFPEDHELSLGMIGMHGTVYANYAVTNSDVLLALGTRFADRATGNVQKFAPNAKIIHVDIDPAELGKNVPVALPIVGGVKEFLTSGGLGAMGYGFPAAIGAQLGNPGKLVLALTGDGSFQMNMFELGTAAQEKLPLKIFVFNNRALGMVKQLQHFYCGRRYSHVDFGFCPDFVQIARAYDAVGIRISRAEEVYPALDEALGNDRLTVVECLVDPRELVYPVVMAGCGLGEVREYDGSALEARTS